MKNLIIGRIYKEKKTGDLTRIFRSGGAGYYSGRGCDKRTAVPYNHYRFENLEEATIDEINSFLEQEMFNQMAQTWNK